jgi:hypothetical protein
MLLKQTLFKALYNKNTHSVLVSVGPFPLIPSKQAKKRFLYACNLSRQITEVWKCKLIVNVNVHCIVCVTAVQRQTQHAGHLSDEPVGGGEAAGDGGVG